MIYVNLFSPRDPQRGGRIPQVTDLPIEDQPQFTSMVTTLFAGVDLTLAFKTMLTIVLVMPYGEYADNYCVKERLDEAIQQGRKEEWDGKLTKIYLITFVIEWMRKREFSL